MVKLFKEQTLNFIVFILRYLQKLLPNKKTKFKRKFVPLKIFLISIIHYPFHRHIKPQSSINLILEFPGIFLHTN